MSEPRISRLVEALHLGDCEWDGNYHCEIHDSRWLSSYVRCVSVIDDLDIAERALELVVPILTDLIAELRGYADEGYIMGASTMRELCARVEEDLREVSGE